MRFGKRGRGRSIGRREASKTALKKNTTAPIPQQGSVAPAMDEMSNVSDAQTQEILAYLSHFSEQLAQADTIHWTDSCMNDLIACMEIAIDEGWTDLAKVLADTGRVLQTYENSQRASEAIPFLQNAYEAMCRLTGDIVIEKSTDESMDYWTKVYSEGQAELLARGLDLYQDDTAAALKASDSTEMQMTSKVEVQTEAPKTLPVLSELPPLDSLVSFEDYAESKQAEAVENLSPNADEAVIENDSIELESPEENEDDNVIEFNSFDASQAEETNDEVEEEIVEASSDEEASVEQYDPPRIVVDIIDRICDVLGSLERDTGDARATSLNIMKNGLEALEHEAKLMKSQVAEAACVTMLEACALVSGGDEAWSDGLVEQSFAFCSVFIEALTDPESENIASWQRECAEWIASCKTVVAEEPEAPFVPLVTEVEIIEDVAEETSVEPEELVSTEVVEETPESEAVEVIVEEAAINYAARSQSLLQSAQEAALKGNTEDVKIFALRAAAEMAKSEVHKAEERLCECEIKLTQGIQNTEDSRESVKSSETAVKESSGLVSESHQSYQDAQKSTAEVADTLETLESGVADLNTQIQDLQARRDAEQEKVAETISEMDTARNAEQQSMSEWEELKVLEGDSRQRLEEARQHVKDRQRMVQDIESAMESARETMTREKGSLSDIVQTIQQISGTATGENDENNSMLF